MSKQFIGTAETASALVATAVVSPFVITAVETTGVIAGLGAGTLLNAAMYAGMVLAIFLLLLLGFKFLFWLFSKIAKMMNDEDVVPQ